MSIVCQNNIKTSRKEQILYKKFDCIKNIYREKKISSEDKILEANKKFFFCFQVDSIVVPKFKIKILIKKKNNNKHLFKFFVKKKCFAKNISPVKIISPVKNKCQLSARIHRHLNQVSKCCSRKDIDL